MEFPINDASSDTLPARDDIDSADDRATAVAPVIAAPATRSGPDIDKLPPPAHSFEEMGLSKGMLRDIHALGFEKPMPIQAQAIPVAMAKRDIVGCAQTGTGKSAAFLIPIIEGIKHTPPKLVKQPGQPACPRALILGPTRELAQQLERHLVELTTGRPVSCAVLVGGKRMHEQYKKLERGVSVVIATPGRLLDHLERYTMTLRALEWIVLDEADRMFDMGFAPQIRRVLRQAPIRGERQTFMFSATMPRDLTALAEEHLLAPVRIEVTPPNVTAEGVHHDVKLIVAGSKIDFLLKLMDDHVKQGGGRVLIFTRRRMDADRLATVLRTRGIECLRMHADRTQDQREAALEKFREGKVEVLVATDLASRGLDVENIVRVINYDFPQTVDDYIHRAGRTARAGARGHATSIVEPGDLPLMREIEKKLGEPLPRYGEELDADSPKRARAGTGKRRRED